MLFTVTFNSSSLVEVLQVVVGLPAVLVVELHEELRDAQAAEDHLGVGDHVLGVGRRGHLQLEAAHEVVGAEGPEVGLLDALHAL